MNLNLLLSKIVCVNPVPKYVTKLLYGKVVDMLYFPIWSGDLPEWLPFWGGKPFTFFNAIFNVADTAISTAVGILIVFNKKAFPKHD